MVDLILVRHGESEWNLENRFAGWTDVDLTPTGIKEAREAGRKLKKKGFVLDEAHTSVLTRAIRTAWLILDEMGLMWIPIHRDWRLNERHYGALQGLNKAETAKKHGVEQVQLWRRGFETSPPPLDDDDKRHPKFDRRYANVDPADLPVGESLATTQLRVLPYWHEIIKPKLRYKKRLLVAAHGNSIRALVKYLEGIQDEEIMTVEIPTGKPLVYRLGEDLKVEDRSFLD